LQSPKVHLEFWVADLLGWSHQGPMAIEEPVEEGESLRALLDRLAGRMEGFAGNIFDPVNQSLSSEIYILINGYVQNISLGLETRLKDGDRILFLPILAGG
jgi:molybdopterin converting factor small subunit